MTVNASRSMNADLNSGLRDGRYKSVVPERGGEPEMDKPVTRASELQKQYNVTDMLRGVHVEGCGCGCGY
jgi:hypothetical protein